MSTRDTALTLDFPTLLSESGAPKFINFISLDVEGHELEVLKRFPFDLFQVGAWIVENPMTDVMKLLEGHGYIMRSVRYPGADGYFVRDEFWSKTLGKKEWRVHPLGSWGC